MNKKHVTFISDSRNPSQIYNTISIVFSYLKSKRSFRSTSHECFTSQFNIYYVIHLKNKVIIVKNISEHIA